MSLIFTLPVPSEFINVVHFLVVDIVCVSFLLHATGVLSGYANNHALVSNPQLNLVPFDVPLIGGGLITWNGWHRLGLILLRISIIIAASASTFGIEGVSQVQSISQSAMIRSPGFTGRIENDTMAEIQRGFSCGTWEDEIFYFGTMANGECYPTVRQYASIRAVTKVAVIEAEALGCTESYACESEKSTTTYRCEKADLVCLGAPRESGCDGVEGLEKDVDDKAKCKAILFPKGGKDVIGCAESSLAPESTGRLMNCWNFEMNPENARWWNETYPRLTLFNARAVFASANGIETRQDVVLPGDVIPVTEVTIWWVVSVGWLALLCILISAFWIRLKLKSARPRLHDTKSLLEMMGSWEFERDRD